MIPLLKHRVQTDTERRDVIPLLKHRVQTDTERRGV